MEPDVSCAIPDGRTRCIHHLHMLLYRGVLIEQGRYIHDLERRLDGKPPDLPPVPPRQPDPTLRTYLERGIDPGAETA